MYPGYHHVFILCYPTSHYSSPLPIYILSEVPESIFFSLVYLTYLYGSIPRLLQKWNTTKNGTQPGTRDCRWFSSSYFIYYFILFIQYAFTSSMISFFIAALILLLFAILIMAIQPYKSSLSHLNFINTLFMIGVSFLFVSIGGHTLSTLFDHQCIYFFSILYTMIGCSIYTFLFCYVLFCIFKSRHLCFTLIQRMGAWRRGYNLLPESHNRETSSIENPEAYPRKNLIN